MITTTPCYTGFGHALLFPAVELKQSVLTLRLWRYFSNWHNGKYVDTQSNDVTIVLKITKELLTLEYRFCIYSWSSGKYKTIIKLKHCIFSRSQVEENKPVFEKVELFNCSFILRQCIRMPLKIALHIFFIKLAVKKRKLHS